MLKRLKSLLQQPEISLENRNGVSEISLAVCVLLLEVANTDDEFSEAENKYIVETMKTRYSLTNEEALELMENASARREESLDLWKFTNKINEEQGREGRMKIMEEIWRVIYADGTLDAHEDYLVHKLANLLRLRHSEMIDAKVKVLRENGK